VAALTPEPPSAFRRVLPELAPQVLVAHIPVLRGSLSTIPGLRDTRTPRQLLPALLYLLHPCSRVQRLVLPVRRAGLVRLGAALEAKR